MKSNIGHLELAAGVVEVIKVLLQMQHKTLVKTLHCEQINPYIQLEGSPFCIVQHNRPWQALQDHTGKSLPRRAGVSSFGFGGVNAHVVLEEYLPAKQAACQPTPNTAMPGLIVLSAKNEHQLKSYAQDMKRWIQTHEELALPDIAFTLQVGRSAMDHRGYPGGFTRGLTAKTRGICR